MVTSMERIDQDAVIALLREITERIDRRFWRLVLIYQLKRLIYRRLGSKVPVKPKDLFIMMLMSIALEGK